MKRAIHIGKWFLGILLGIFLLITLLLYIYKDEICGLVVTEVNKYLKTEVIVSDVELTFWGSFPNLAVDFNEVFIRDSYDGATKYDTLLYSDQIRLKFDPMDIWNGNYEVKSAEIQPGVLKLKVNEEGVNNFDIIKETSDTTEGDFKLALKAVDFENFRFSYLNASTDQQYETRINEMHVEGAFDAAEFNATAASNIQILAARSGKITLVSNKAANLNVGVYVNKDSSLVRIPQSTIFIEDLPFEFSSEVIDSSFTISIKAKNIQLEDAANKLAMQQTADVKKFSGKGSVQFDLDIHGDNNPIQPVHVDCKFGIKNGELIDPNSGIELKGINVDGFYTNKGGRDKEQLALNNIAFRTKGGPFKGNVLVRHFDKPVFSGDAVGTLDLSVVHSLYPFKRVDELKGAVDLTARFKVESNADHYEVAQCDGDMKLKSVRVKLVNDKRVFESINGSVYLRKDEVGLQNISLKLGSSDFHINGIFEDAIPYMSGESDLKANLEIESKRINIDQDLGNETREQKIEQARAFILPNNISGKVYMDVDEMIYDKHSFYNLRGNMSIGKRMVHFPKISVQNGGVDIYGSLTVLEQSPEIYRITSHVVSKNINFKSLFKEWEDFKQTTIKSSNIEGDAQANVEFTALFDLRSGIISKSIEARAGIQVDNGRLKDVDAFQTIVESLKDSKAKLLFKKEELNELGNKLTDLRFKQLKNTLVIRDRVLSIPEMSIESSALSIELAGKHNFDNVVDYKFGFYFRDLKLPEESEFGIVQDDDLGINVYMRMHGSIESPTIEWDWDAFKKNIKEYNAQEKKNIKSMLKSDFGLYKKDTTVREYVKTERPHEDLIIQFDPMNELDTVIEGRTPKKDKKLPKFLQKWKQEADKEEKVDFEIDD